MIRAEDIMSDFEKIRVLVRSNGEVHWEPGGVFMTTCDIDIKYFPFDSQVRCVWPCSCTIFSENTRNVLQACNIGIGAWAYTSSRMNLTNVAMHIETGQLTINGEWLIYDTASAWNEITIPNGPDIGYSSVRANNIHHCS